MKKETATITVRVYPSTHQALKVAAAKKRLPISRLIAELIRNPTGKKKKYASDATYPNRYPGNDAPLYPRSKPIQDER